MEDVYDVFNTRSRLELLIGCYHKMGAREFPQDQETLS